MNLLSFLAGWGLLGCAVALYAGPRLRSLTNDTPRETSDRCEQHIRKEAA